MFLYRRTKRTAVNQIGKNLIHTGCNIVACHVAAAICEPSRIGRCQISVSVRSVSRRIFLKIRLHIGILTGVILVCQILGVSNQRIIPISRKTASRKLRRTFRKPCRVLRVTASAAHTVCHRILHKSMHQFMRNRGLQHLSPASCSLCIRQCKIRIIHAKFQNLRSSSCRIELEVSLCKRFVLSVYPLYLYRKI